jgi:NADH-quinone oxidoreductase subunit C
MTPEEIAARLGGTVSTSAGGGAHARPALDVPPERWSELVTAARDELGCDFFDWLSAVDELGEGFTVVAHLYSTGSHRGVLLRTRVGREEPRLASVAEVFAGAAWHERETHEMFGVRFGEGAQPEPLLLPDGFEGHPLRKDFVLASRVVKPWPGAKEPGESDGDIRADARGDLRGSSPGRRRMKPPGVPDDWLQSEGEGGDG